MNNGERERERVKCKERIYRICLWNNIRYRASARATIIFFDDHEYFPP